MKDSERVHIKQLFSDLNAKASNEIKNQKRPFEETQELSSSSKRIKVDKDITILKTLMMMSDDDIIRLLEFNNQKTNNIRHQVSTISDVYKFYNELN